MVISDLKLQIASIPYANLVHKHAVCYLKFDFALSVVSCDKFLTLDPPLSLPHLSDCMTLVSRLAVAIWIE